VFIINFRRNCMIYRYILMLLALLCGFNVSYAGSNIASSEINSSEVPSLKNPNLTKVTDRVYALIGEMAIPNEINDGFISNTVFVITDDGVVVVDPGGSLQIGQMVIDEIRKVTDKPITHVIDTHHHADHWMGNDAFSRLDPRPVIIGHQIMKDTAEEIGERWLEIISNLTKGKNKGTKLVLPDQIVKGNEALKIGGLTFQLYHPEHAHTEDDIGVYIPEEKVLLPGDILFYLRTPGFQDASPMGNAQALQELKKLDFIKVVPGHGPVTDRSGIDYMLDFIQVLHDEVKKYMDEGLADYEMKEKINVGKFSAMSGFKDRIGIAVNRMFLEIEEQEF